MKENGLILYDDKYSLKAYEVVFIEAFKETHSLKRSLELLTKSQEKKVSATLRTGTSNLSKAYLEFVQGAPTHPEANKVVILDNLIWIMNQSKEDKDTNGVLRAISEINKMIKGNLVTSSEKTVVEKHIVGIIDLTKNNEDEEVLTIEIDEDGKTKL